MFIVRTLVIIKMLLRKVFINLQNTHPTHNLFLKFSYTLLQLKIKSKTLTIYNHINPLTYCTDIYSLHTDFGDYLVYMKTMQNPTHYFASMPKIFCLFIDEE